MRIKHKNAEFESEGEYTSGQPSIRTQQNSHNALSLHIVKIGGPTAVLFSCTCHYVQYISVFPACRRMLMRWTQFSALQMRRTTTVAAVENDLRQKLQRLHVATCIRTYAYTFPVNFLLMTPVSSVVVLYLPWAPFLWIPPPNIHQKFPPDQTALSDPGLGLHHTNSWKPPDSRSTTGAPLRTELVSSQVCHLTRLCRIFLTYSDLFQNFTLHLGFFKLNFFWPSLARSFHAAAIGVHFWPSINATDWLGAHPTISYCTQRN